VKVFAELDMPERGFLLKKIIICCKSSRLILPRKQGTFTASSDDFAKSHRTGRHGKKLQMQGARSLPATGRLRNEAYIEVRRNDER